MTEVVATAEARAERIRAGAEQAKAWIEDVMAAAVDGDWKTLDYGSWQEYCDDVIGERVQLQRGERQEIVGRMREAGMSTRAIGAALGTDKRTVGRDLDAGGADAPPDEPSPQPVTGLDGKTYEPTKPTPQSAPEPPPLPEHQDEAEQAAAGFDELAARRAESPQRPEPPSAEAIAERDARASAAAYTKHISMAVQYLADLNYHPSSAYDQVTKYDPTLPEATSFRLPVTPERIRVAAQYLLDLADAWERAA